ncbi:MAG: DUF411 domain-containing protein [Candidatus Competibacteraceae bacterium]|nr:DUF411 domain-containing protein [Candidatus Competibacteraceae bacterium]
MNEIDLKRRQLLAGSLLLLAPRVWAATEPSNTATAVGPVVEVWRSPACGCCKDWVAHMEKNGFIVKVNDNGSSAARRRFGIAERYGSCHTAEVGGYALEGHVPASEVRRLLAERPDAIGLAVPKMPIGSPGMDGPEYGGEHEPYEVLLLTKDGNSRVFHAYR